jgi:hypothetical protein
MLTFEEWLVENHPEMLDENWRQTMGALALGAASLFPMANAQAAQPNNPQAAATQSVSQNQRARLDAMKRVSAVHKFKKNWGSEFGSQQDQKLFDTILKLQTEKDHDDFLYKIKKDQEDFMRGTAHPEPSVQQSEIRQVYNSFNYQYLDYIKALATASKINL